MKNLTATISFAVCIIFAISCKKESNFLLNDKQPERFQFHYGSNSGFETYRLRLSESYSVIITAFVDSNGVVTLTDSIVSAASSDKYSVIDLRPIQLDAPGNPNFDSSTFRVLTLNAQNNGVSINDQVSSLANGPVTNTVYCECTAGSNHQYCNPVTSGSIVYCDASSIFCEYCTLIVVWDEARIEASDYRYSAVILNN